MAMHKNYPQPILKRPLAGSAFKAVLFFSMGILIAGQFSGMLWFGGNSRHFYNFALIFFEK